MVSLSGKRVLITGASSGIGKAFARELARRGAVLAVAARRADALAALADEVERAGGVRPVVLTADLSLRADQIYPTTLSEFDITVTGRPDGIIRILPGDAGQDRPALAFEVAGGDSLSRIDQLLKRASDLAGDEDA